MLIDFYSALDQGLHRENLWECVCGSLTLGIWALDEHMNGLDSKLSHLNITYTSTIICKIGRGINGNLRSGRKKRKSERINIGA